MPDRCRERPTFSGDRFLIFLPVFLAIMPGSLILFIWLEDRPFGIQFASMIGYSAAAFLYTFSSNRGLPRYLFTCPAVQGQLSRLAVRHLAFIIALLISETTALQLRPKLSDWWLTARGKDMPPFVAAVSIVCGSLLLAQVLTNRSLLKNAHLEYDPD
jgi:hypothetical protein